MFSLISAVIEISLDPFLLFITENNYHIIDNDYQWQKAAYPSVLVGIRQNSSVYLSSMSVF